MGIVKSTKLQGRISLIVIAILLLLVPFITNVNNYIMHFFIQAFIWAIVAEAWNLIMGYAGIFSFGQIAFFTIGAFGTGLITQQLGVSPWVSIFYAGIVTAFIGLLIGLPSLRLRGEYICVITYALHLIMPALLYRGEPIGINRGAFIWNIPALNILGYVFKRNAMLPWYYVGIALFAFFMFLIFVVIKSPIGKAFVALRDAELLAKSLGVNEYKYKLIVFSLSAFLTGTMGAFYAHYVGTISARMLGLDFFVKALIMVILGGLGQFPGPAIGAFVIIFLDELLRPLGNFRMVVLGSIVIFTMIYLPKGLMSFSEYSEKLRNLIRKRKEA
jgi:branched-chain amino acid transport system permease protein